MPELIFKDSNDQGLDTCSPKYASENIYSTIKIQVVSCQPQHYKDFRYHILTEYFIILLLDVFRKDFEFSCLIYVVCLD